MLGICLLTICISDASEVYVAASERISNFRQNVLDFSTTRDPRVPNSALYEFRPRSENFPSRTHDH